MRIDLVGHARGPAEVDVSRVLMGYRRDARFEQPDGVCQRYDMTDHTPQTYTEGSSQ
jgi:hypothetical protein